MPGTAMLFPGQGSQAVGMGKALFDEGMTPEVFSWDDASDNRFLASGVACWIHDAISAYRSTEDTNPKVFQQTGVALEPQGLPGKRVSIANPNAYADSRRFPGAESRPWHAVLVRWRRV